MSVLVRARGCLKTEASNAIEPSAGLPEALEVGSAAELLLRATRKEQGEIEICASIGTSAISQLSALVGAEANAQICAGFSAFFARKVSARATRATRRRPHT